MRFDHDWFPRDLPSNVQIGERSWVYSSFAFLHCKSNRPVAVKVGRDTGIYHGSFFELGPDGEVEIGDYCSVVGAIISVNSRVEIGDYAFVAHEVVIADSPHAVPPQPESASCSPVFGQWNSRVNKSCIRIGENAWVGARAILLPGCDLGEGAIVGAAAVVNFKVPPYSIVAGNPAKIVTSQPKARNGVTP